MKTIRELELELIVDWHSLQLLKSTLAKAVALKAYYLKYAQYRKARNWRLVLLEPVMI